MMASALKLTPEQRQAVEHGEGALLVIAGPGSGKTRVITQRIVYLLKSVPQLEAHNVLALTYTDKAAAEMGRRVREALPHLKKLPPISTFHALCLQVLRERHFERRLLDQFDLWIFLRRRQGELGLEHYQKLPEPGAFLHDLNEFFTRCQDELVEPGDFEGYVERAEAEFRRWSSTLDPAERMRQAQELEKKQELARVFRRSRKLIEEAGYSTFGSLISEAVRLWDREPLLLEQHRARFRYVLVDEFQDTNYAQVEVLRRLIVRPWNITAVGDDDQAIYRFRGAAHGAFAMFDEAFPGARKVYLHRNHRSARKILRAADVVIARNQRYEEKPALAPEKEDAGVVSLVECPDHVSEAAWVAGEIERLARQGRRLGEIAALYRIHRHRDALVAEFRRRQIPFAIRGLSILDTVIIRDLVAYLKLIHSPHDNVSLTRVLLTPRWRFPETLGLEIRRQAARSRCSIFTALEAMEQSLFKGELERTGWADLTRLLGDLKEADSSMTGLLEQLIGRLSLHFSPGDKDGAYVESFKKFLREWEEKSETRRLAEFMEYFQYFGEAGGSIEAPEPEDASRAVQMMTVHAAKGLEFPVVFVIGIGQQRFPQREQKAVIEFPDSLRRGPQPPRDIHLQEERRLFYVAMTRAQERLYLSSLVKTGRRPSVFVDDLLSNAVVQAHDIERIQVAAIPAGGTAAVTVTPPRTPLQPPGPLPASEGGVAQQPSLFDALPASVRAFYPDLESWARQPVVPAPDGKLRLSATSIEEYLKCPLKFKLNYYLKVPTGPQGPLTFGSIMHRSVRHYFALRKKFSPAFEDLKEFYLGAWRDAGFEDSYQEQAYKKAGLEQLRRFVEVQGERPIPAEDVRLEESFTLDLGDVVLEGRIDQIHPLTAVASQGRPDSKPVCELVDYKTGKPQSQHDADQSLQLSIYALAARRLLGIEPARLTFYNLTNNQPVSTARTERNLEAALVKVRDVAANVRRLLFDPTPGFVCRHCDFVPLCPAHEEVF